jgi:hypothetical protein
MIVLNICFSVIILLVGYNFKHFFSGFTKYDKKLLTRLFFYHFGFTVIFYFYLHSYGGDAIQYWEVPKKGDFSDIMFRIVNRRANNFIYLVNYFPSAVLQLSLFTGNLIYSLLGYLGFIFLYKLIKETIPNLNKVNRFKILGVPIFPWILFLPNLHFWSSAIGKDVLLFFSVILFVYSLYKVRKRWGLLIISILLSLAVRPHITLFLFIAFGLGYIIDGKLAFYQKIIIVTGFLVAFVGIFDYVIQFIQLESLDVKTIEDYAATKVKNLSDITSGSAVDISGYPFPLKMFTFLYRPLFFDINGVFAIIASLENLVLLIFTFLLFKNKPITGLKKSGFLLKGMILYFLIGSIAFSYILGNLGIMLRQKNMLIPIFIVFGLSIIFRNSLKINNSSRP